LPYGASLLYPEEVAEQILSGTLPRDEKIGEAELEDDELIVHILHDDPMDKRIDGYPKRDEVITLARIRREFVNADAVAWTRDEDENAVLLCL
jgi:hypothetical protein